MIREQTLIVDASRRCGADSATSGLVAGGGADRRGPRRQLRHRGRRRKEPYDLTKLPLSVTPVDGTVLLASHITTLSDAAIASPNTFFSNFQARKLSFPRFRGISSGPGNPGITTYVDGVPMIHTNTSSIELLDVEQVEIVRGAQSALFGRNAIGGVINVLSTRPSIDKWTGNVTVPLGSFGTAETRGAVSGPIASNAAVSIAGGRSMRDGFTVNDITGNDIDTRQNTFGKAQIVWLPKANFETRVIVSGERARDGDYGLNDLAALRQDPFHVQRDFEGSTERDILSTAILTRLEKQSFSLSTTTGIVDWNTVDQTDLDYSPFPALGRLNKEDARQFTQEVRLASAANAPLRLSSATRMRWQVGAFYFNQGYNQDAVNSYAPGVISPQLPFAISEQSPKATLDDSGIGVYGLGTFMFGERLEVGVGARVDREMKDAVLETFTSPAISAPTSLTAERSFINVSPQASISFQPKAGLTTYASVNTGYKSGGFNPASPVGTDEFGEEHTWQFETGMKKTYAGGRLLTSAAFFYIDWDDMQLNVPNPFVPAQYYIANVAGARSTGLEIELNGRAAQGVDLFGSLGYTNSRFSSGSVSRGTDVSGNALPSTPDYTAMVGARYNRPISGNLSLHASGEVAFTGGFNYDDAATASQDAYGLTHIRGGVTKGVIVIDGWIRNAFDTRYVPVAFDYPGLAPSGFVGELGAPRTFGISLGLRF